MPRKLHYYALGLFVAIATFLAITWVPVLPLWFMIISSSTAGTAWETSWTLFTLALTDARAATMTFYVIVSFFVGANTSLLAYYWRTRRTIGGTDGATGALGALIALLGFGCASCGSLFLTLVLSGLGGAGLAALPPESDLWLKSIGVALLAFSFYELVRHVRDPLVCPVQ